MTFNVISSPFRVCFSSRELSRPGERGGTEAMAAAKSVWCSGSNDFDDIAVRSGSPRSPCLPLDALGTEAAKRRCLAEVLDELESDSSDSCWSATSESSSSSSSDTDDEVYAAAFHHLFSTPEQRLKVEAHVRKTLSSWSDEEVGRSASERGESLKGLLAHRFPLSHLLSRSVLYSIGRWSGPAPKCSAPYSSLHEAAALLFSQWNLPFVSKQ